MFQRLITVIYVALPRRSTTTSLPAGTPSTTRMPLPTRYSQITKLPFSGMSCRFYGILNALGLYNKEAKILFLVWDAC